jgi:hypothetical protein
MPHTWVGVHLSYCENFFPWAGASLPWDTAIKTQQTQEQMYNLSAQSQRSPFFLSIHPNIL